MSRASGRAHSESPVDRGHGGQAAGDEPFPRMDPMSDGSRPYAANWTGAARRPKTSDVARSASCAGSSPEGDAGARSPAHGLDGVGASAGQLAELVVLDEKKKPESRGFLAYARQKAGNTSRQLLARARFRFRRASGAVRRTRM